MPAAIWPGSKAPRLAGIGLSELQRPAPYRLIGDINAALGEQILDAATVKKMPGVTLVSEKAENGPRRYRVEAAGA